MRDVARRTRQWIWVEPGRLMKAHTRSAEQGNSSQRWLVREDVAKGCWTHLRSERGQPGHGSARGIPRCGSVWRLFESVARWAKPIRQRSGFCEAMERMTGQSAQQVWRADSRIDRLLVAVTYRHEWSLDRSWVFGTMPCATERIYEPRRVWGSRLRGGEEFQQLGRGIG